MDSTVIASNYIYIVSWGTLLGGAVLFIYLCFKDREQSSASAYAQLALGAGFGMLAVTCIGFASTWTDYVVVLIQTGSAIIFIIRGLNLKRTLAVR